MSRNYHRDPNYIWTSVSQDQLFRACQRKWAAKYIFKMPEPPSKATTFGTEVHEGIENWYLHAKPPTKHQRVVTGMLKMLPPRDVSAGSLHVEQRLELPVLEAEGPQKGVRLLGYADLVHVAPDRTVVFDHKTTSDPRWAKTMEDIQKGDVQLCVYTRWAQEHLLAEEVEVQLTYGLSRGRKPPWVVHTRIAQEVVDKVWDEVCQNSRQMRDARCMSEPQLGDFKAEYDSDACQMFGGCPYKAACNAAKKVEVDMDTKALLAKLAAAKAKAAEATEATQTPAEAPPADPINPPEAEAVPEKAEPDPEPEPKPKAPRKKRAKKVETPPPAEAEAPSPSAGPAAGGLHVYVDCLPLKGAPEPVMLLEDIVGAAARAVEEKAEVPHWSLAEYATGAGGLASEFFVPECGTVLVNSYTAEGKALLTKLVAAAVAVVKG